MYSTSLVFSKAAFMKSNMPQIFIVCQFRFGYYQQIQAMFQILQFVEFEKFI